ncbi:MAG: ABC transporter permease [Candidatus Berkelbacteria bacterium]|nr:ABC transporter permease [Candidatus Berkelbacteria bacterium]
MKNNSNEHIIRPPKGLVDIDLPEIWRFRELLYVFAWRDIKVRYKQTFVGVAWAIFQPFITMVIFTVIFGRLAKVPSEGAPYPIFVYSGLLFWNYFSGALTAASDCLVANESIVKKVYFPRLLLPVSTAVTPLIDFAFAFLILVGMMIYYHFTPSLLGVVMIPVLLLISLVASSGLGLFLAAVNAKFRDVRYVLPFSIQILMYVTPVIYPVSIIPPKYQWLIFLNPMTGVINCARSLLLHTGAMDWTQFLISTAVGFGLLILGVTYFRKTERFFADIL